MKQFLLNSRIFIITSACLFTLSTTQSSGEENKTRFASPPMPAYRIEARKFEASEQDIRKLLDSTGRELWRFFPDYEIEPFVVSQNDKSPIVWFKRNDRKEIVMKLNTGKTYWSQYAYQFSHEFCHILCGFDDDYQGNQWFEEMICESASLFVMKAMARSWKDDPPYPHWSDYRHALDQYVDQRIARFRDVKPEDLAQLFRDNRTHLMKEPKYENLQAKMAIVVVRLFETKPQRWEAIRWLNDKASPKGQSFEQYLNAWYQAVPGRHQEFVGEIAKLFEVRIELR